MSEKKEPKDVAIEKFVSDHLNNPDSGSVLTIREGIAPKQLDAIQPQKVELSGTIKAPSEFYAKRRHLHSPDKCHVIYDRTAGTIELVFDEQYSSINYKITGKIEPNPDLKAFCINTNKMFTVKELMSILKFNRVHFADKDSNATIVLSLQNFKAKVEKSLTDTTTLRGNEEQSRLVKLEHELEESFFLFMPIHKGGSSYKFQVDICISATSADVQVWLESKDLKELQDTSGASMIEEELKNFVDIVCIEK
jgi:hypothetical protein